MRHTSALSACLFRRYKESSPRSRSNLGLNRARDSFSSLSEPLRKSPGREAVSAFMRYTLWPEGQKPSSGVSLDVKFVTPEIPIRFKRLPAPRDLRKTGT